MRWTPAVAAVVAFAALGCGPDVVSTPRSSGASGDAAAGGPGSSTSSAGAGGAATGAGGSVTSSAGAAGPSSSTAGGVSGVGGSGGSLACAPGSVEPCYDGPAGTEGIGICAAGQRTCLDDGSGYGPCEAQVLPGIDDCATSLDEDCTASTCPVALVWAKSADSVGAMAVDVAVDGAGNVIVVGVYGNAPLDLGGPPLPTTDGGESFVVKLDPAGNHVWSRSLVGASSQYIARVAVDAGGNVILAGNTSGTLELDGQPLATDAIGFVLKLDPDGNLVWSSEITGGALEIGGLAMDGGEIMVSGTFTTLLELQGLQLTTFDVMSDSFLVRLHGDTGNLAWGKALPNTGQQSGDGIAIDPSGYILMSGRSWISPITVGGPFIGTGGPIMFVARFDGNGTHLWSEAVKGTASNALKAGATPTGDLFWAGGAAQLTDFGGGLIAGSDDAFVVKVSSGGAYLWSRDFTPATSDSRIFALATDSLGNVAVGGRFNGAIDFGLGTLTAGPQSGPLAGFVTKLDASGNAVWSAMLGADTATVVNGLAFAPTGHVIAVGYFLAEVDFWGTSLFGPPGGGLFIAKLGP